MKLQIWSWDAPAPDSSAERCDKWISGALERGEGSWSTEAPPITRSQLQRLIENGKLSFNGKSVTKAGTRALEAGRWELTIPEASDRDPL